jgi:membrane protease YdiL (CAAX protease family)
MSAPESLPERTNETRVPFASLLLPFVGLIIFLIPLLLLGIASRSCVMLGVCLRSDLVRIQTNHMNSYIAVIGLAAWLYTSVFLVLYRYVRKRPDLPIARFSTASAESITFSMITAALVAMALLAYDGFPFSPDGSSLSASSHVFFPSTGVELLVALAVSGLLGPITEEMYFRGLLLSWLNQRVGALPSAILSALAFALHPRFVGSQNWAAVIGAAIVGLSNAAWTFNSKSLWPAVAAHVTYNATLLLVLFGS